MSERCLSKLDKFFEVMDQERWHFIATRAPEEVTVANHMFWIGLMGEIDKMRPYKRLK